VATSTNAGQFETPVTWTQNTDVDWERSAVLAAQTINRVHKVLDELRHNLEIAPEGPVELAYITSRLAEALDCE